MDYKTVSREAAAEIVEKKSRFIAAYSPCPHMPELWNVWSR